MKRVNTSDCELFLSPDHIFSLCLNASENHENVLRDRDRKFKEAFRRRRTMLARRDHPGGRGKNSSNSSFRQKVLLSPATPTALLSLRPKIAPAQTLQGPVLGQRGERTGNGPRTESPPATSPSRKKTTSTPIIHSGTSDIVIE